MTAIKNQFVVSYENVYEHLDSSKHWKLSDESKRIIATEAEAILCYVAEYEEESEQYIIEQKTAHDIIRQCRFLYTDGVRTARNAMQMAVNELC